MLLEGTSIILVAVILYRFIYYIRYDFALLPLYVLTTLQGHNFRTAHTREEIKKAFLSDNKGSVIEELFATPAWKPILSIESVNGSLWQTLKKNFLVIQKELPPKAELGNIAEIRVKIFLDECGNRINSRDISKLTLRIFTDWIFKDSSFEYEDRSFDSLSEDMIERLYLASVEFKRTIALKGEGCMRIKQDSVNLMVDLLSHNSKFKHLFNDWSEPVNYSAVMQPLLISPMINVPDIAVSVLNNWHSYVPASTDVDKFIDVCIQAAHPFPMLERFDEATNTQIFIDLNSLDMAERNLAYNYSLGPRACIGRHYAREFLARFFKVILERNGVQFMALEHHNYSGRNNDNGNLAESIYQFKLLFSVMATLIGERISKINKTIKKTLCRKCICSFFHL